MKCGMSFWYWHEKAIVNTLPDVSLLVDIDISGLIMELMWTSCLTCMNIYELALNSFKYEINIFMCISNYI
jgi:hypothetical protein